MPGQVVLFSRSRRARRPAAPRPTVYGKPRLASGAESCVGPERQSYELPAPPGGAGTRWVGWITTAGSGTDPGVRCGPWRKQRSSSPSFSRGSRVCPALCHRQGAQRNCVPTLQGLSAGGWFTFRIPFRPPTELMLFKLPYLPGKRRQSETRCSRPFGCPTSGVYPGPAHHGALAGDRQHLAQHWVAAILVLTLAAPKLPGE